MKDKFLFFKNFKTVADKLPDDLRLKFYDAITSYVFEGIEPEDPVIAALVGAIKPSLDKEEKRGGNHNPTGQNQHKEVKTGQTRSNEVKTSQENSKEGQRGQSFQDKETGSRKQEVKEKDTLKGIKKEKEIDLEDWIANKKPRIIFTPPTKEQVQAYIDEKSLMVDAQKFINYFEAGNWIDSEGKKVKNWKQKLITWDSKERTLRAAKNLIPLKTGVASGTYGKDIPL